jgi:peroxiredoxin
MTRARLAGPLVVLALVAALPGHGGGAEIPYKTLDLIRPARPAAAKPFTVPSPTGPPVSLRDFKGKVVLLNFWATWCPPCKEEMPSMERLHQRYRKRGFTVLAISIDADGAAAVVPFAKNLGVTFPIGLDPKMALATEYGVRALPSTFVIDRHGSTVAMAIGPRDWDSKAAHEVVEALLE